MHVREEVSSCRTGDALTARRICMWDGHVGSDDRVGRICGRGNVLDRWNGRVGSDDRVGRICSRGDGLVRCDSL